MIDHGNASDEDFIILKCADHDLPESKELVEHDIKDLSKRKLKLSRNVGSSDTNRYLTTMGTRTGCMRWLTRRSFTNMR